MAALAPPVLSWKPRFLGHVPGFRVVIISMMKIIVIIITIIVIMAIIFIIVIIIRLLLLPLSTDLGFQDMQKEVPRQS